MSSGVRTENPGSSIVVCESLPEKIPFSENVTPATPGMAATRSRSECTNWLSGVPRMPRDWMSRSATMRWSRSNPTSVSWRLRRLRTRMAAPTSNTTDRATCPEMSRLPRGRRRPPRRGDRPAPGCAPLRIVAARSTRDACSAGARPNTATASTETTSVNTRIVELRPPPMPIAAPPAARPMSQRLATLAKRSPAPALSSASTPASVSSWRTSLARFAPSARRTDISRPRARERARSRFATFAQMMQTQLRHSDHERHERRLERAAHARKPLRAGCHPRLGVTLLKSRRDHGRRVRHDASYDQRPDLGARLP